MVWCERLKVGKEIDINDIEGIALAALGMVSDLQSDVFTKKEFIFKSDSVLKCYSDSEQGGKEHFYRVLVRIYLKGFDCIRLEAEAVLDSGKNFKSVDVELYELCR